MVEVVYDSNQSLDCLEAVCSKYNVRKAIVATVIDLNECVLAQLGKLPVPILWLNCNTPLPVTNLYETPETLGYDRMAAVVAANDQFPGKDILVIDAGTCITYEFIDSLGQYHGGNISPGLWMRLKALHQFTGRLPLINAEGRLPGTLAPEIIEKAEREGRKFFEGNPQDNYPDSLDKYRKLMKENKWEVGEDDEELFEYAMHPAQYEAYKSGKAKEDFLADVAKRRAEKDKSPEEDAKPKTLTVQVDGQAYRVTVAYGDAELPAAPVAAAPAGEGKDVLSPLEGKFFLVKNAQESALKVGDAVKEGDVLCYVEAMKTYNAIRAEFSGTITAICANPGDTVSEDDVLMKIG